MTRLHVTSIIFCLLTLSLYASAESPGIYRVSTNAEDLLVTMKSTVYHGKMDGDFIAELDEKEVDRLLTGGFRVESLNFGIDETDEFHSYQLMLDGLQNLAITYPDIVQFVQFGLSVQNRQLFGVKITDNPTIDEAEPAIAFWGCIHGNEYGGAEMPYLYAEYLVQNYGIDPAITGYIDHNEIWCIPLINPDGRVNGTRNNANGIDLNREFGYNWDSWGGSQVPFSQVETQTVREFAIENSVTLSISYHCFGNEFYYPWGYFPSAAPDYNVLIRVGGRYADAADYALMSSFNSYQTHGEILDWAYGCLGGLSFTAEVSNSSSGVPATFDRNRPGMNLYCAMAGEGINGMVTDAVTGEPLHAALWLNGNQIPSYSDPNFGDVHRILLPGTYNLTVWANGYMPQYISNISVETGAPGQFTAQLQPSDGEYAFMVVSVNQHDPNNAYNNATFPAWALGEPDGKPCSLGLDGFIVLDMGEGHEIVDGPGNDFTVTEIVHPRDPDPERYRVYAGDAYFQDELIGIGEGTTSFDLSSTGVTSTRYLKILDMSGASPNLALAGFDLDGVTILNSASTSLPQNNQPEFATAKSQAIELQSAPNPFNPTTVLSYKLQVACSVNLAVFDISGRQVAKLVNGWRDAGIHSVIFDASGLPSGIYFSLLRAGEYEQTQKLLLIK